MGVKPDKWIREQCKKGMIKPYEDSQVSRGVISYGISSYGYDMRIADEFKIFTNIYSTVVDPKNFSEKSFVDFKGKECTIPPNSFALARSLEYFKIPRDILCIVLGKSTYARMGIIVNVTPLEPCYDKETELLTLTGWKKFSEINDNEIVATLNREGEIEHQKIEKKQTFHHTGKLIHINGRNIDLAVTSAHQLFVRKRGDDYFDFVRADKVYGKYNYELKRDAKWTSNKADYFVLPSVLKSTRYLNELNIKEEIIKKLKDKILTTKELHDGFKNRISYREFQAILSELHEQGILGREAVFLKREVDSNKIYTWKVKENAMPGFLKEYLSEIKIPMDDWLRFLGIWLAEGSFYKSKTKRDYIVKIAAFGENKKKIERRLQRLPFHYFSTDTGFTIINKQLYLYLKKFGHAPEKFVPQEIKALSPGQLKIFLKAFMLGDGNEETQTFTTTSKRLADDLQEIILKCGWASIVRRIPKEKMSKLKELKGRIVQAKHDLFRIRISKKQLTPKIYKDSFSLSDYDDFVYDVTVPNHTLYVRRNGKACWSSNCWEGYVTIEISNTTPLPVRIYANEGIAQVLFLSADEICEISYKDKKGKYQRQTGIWLPKTE